MPKFSLLFQDVCVFLCVLKFKLVKQNKKYLRHIGCRCNYPKVCVSFICCRKSTLKVNIFPHQCQGKGFCYKHTQVWLFRIPDWENRKELVRKLKGASYVSTILWICVSQSFVSSVADVVFHFCVCLVYVSQSMHWR